jgi:HD superfamily phosphohydrolase
MINHLEKRGSPFGHTFQDDEKIALKIAALLHDIGHIPLSHVGEEVLRTTFKPDTDTRTAQDEIRLPAGELDWSSLFPSEYVGSMAKLHECLSAEVVLHSREIDRELRKVKGWSKDSERTKWKKKIAQIIVGKSDINIAGSLLHSELDADRLDYLLRDSFFTGVGYGHIDLDYIISRLAVLDEDNNVSTLCLEEKGLHTIEHYILGRFFLQTQVIYNRKVRFLDLLFADVMRYMVNAKGDKKWHLMGLAEFLGHIREIASTPKKGNTSQNDCLHRIYEYTDAQVFTNMRLLHDEFDREIGKKNSSTVKDSEESYINDCIKTIMDGQVPEPVLTRQKIVDLAKDQAEIEKEANDIANKVAKKLGIFEGRIKADIVSQEVMKYKGRLRVDEEGNREAVMIVSPNTDVDDKQKPAAESNATILKGLVDKALLILNVYYVRPKTENDTAAAENGNAIKKAYEKFVAKHFLASAE